MNIRIVTLLFSLALCGCLSVPITSVPKLLALKPETMEISGVELAVRVQDDFVIYDDGAKMFFEAPKSATDEVLRQSITLLPIKTELTPYLQSQTKRGFYINRYRVSPEDVEAFEIYRNEVLAERELGIGKKKSSVLAAAGGCVMQGANPFQDIKMTFYLKSDPDKKFFKMFREQKLPIATDKDDKGKIPYCNEKPKDEKSK